MRDVNFERLTKRAIAIFTQERAALLNNDPVELEKAKAAKLGLLTDLQNAEASIGARLKTEASTQTFAQISSLHAIIQRRTNENIQLARANQIDGQSD